MHDVDPVVVEHLVEAFVRPAPTPEAVARSDDEPTTPGHRNPDASQSFCVHPAHETRRPTMATTGPLMYGTGIVGFP